MKKTLLTTLIGVLSLCIHSYSIAEDVVVEPNTTTTTTEEATTASVSSAIPEETAPAIEVEVAPTPQPAILGEAINLRSLRGSTSVSDESEEFPNRRIMVVDGGIDVTFSDQPPMVPHNVDKDRISLQENTCLKCHSKVDAKLENAPRPTPSHFKGRDGAKQNKIVAGRYFCTQCHTPQANKRSLVKNTFKD